jgi:hypothetical protein
MPRLPSIALFSFAQDKRGNGRSGECLHLVVDFSAHKNASTRCVEAYSYDFFSDLSTIVYDRLGRHANLISPSQK